MCNNIGVCARTYVLWCGGVLVYVGRPLAVTNVLLGQPASATSQCHERPSFAPLGKFDTQFPTMAGSKIYNITGKDDCLAACQERLGCFAVSYMDTTEGGTCILSPSPLLGNGVVWKNLIELGSVRCLIVGVTLAEKSRCVVDRCAWLVECEIPSCPHYSVRVRAHHTYLAHTRHRLALRFVSDESLVRIFRSQLLVAWLILQNQFY